MSLLLTSCSKKNFRIFKKIFEFIEKNFSIPDFTNVFLEACFYGSEEIFQYLIDKKIFINYTEIINQYWKIFNGNWKIAIKLIDMVNPEMKKPLSRLLFNESVNKKCKEAFEILLDSNLDGKNVLFKAIVFHDIELIKKILKYNSEPSFINHLSRDGTILKVSIKNNDLDIAKLLLSIPGIDLEARISLGFTPLIQAIHDLNIEAIDLLLEYYGENIQSELWQFEIAIRTLFNYVLEKEKNGIENYEDKTICILNKMVRINKNLSTCCRDFFSDACQRNSVKMASKLLNVEGINVNFQTSKYGDTPLIIAIKNKCIEIVNLLLDFPSTDINLSNFNGQTPLIAAIQNNMTSIVTDIINHPRFDPIKSNINFAFFIYNTNDEEILKLFMSKENFDVNFQYDNSVFIETKRAFTMIDTSLTYGIKQMQIKKVDLILSHPNFDPIKSNVKGAIFEAIRKNQKELFQKLFKNFNDVNIISYSGKSLIRSLIEQGEFDLLKDTLKIPNIKIEDYNILDNFILFLELNEKSSFELLSILIDYDEKHNHCIDFTHLLPNGKSFFTIINPSNPNINEIVQLLLDHNVDPNQPDSYQMYPLQYAIETNSLPFVKSLIDSKKIDYNVRLNKPISPEMKNETYLHLAARCSDKKILKLFLDQNLIDLNTTDDLDETALIKAKNAKKKANYQMIENKLKKDINSISENEDENDDDDKKSMTEKFELFQTLINRLTELTSISHSEFDVKLVENFKFLAERKDIIKKLQDLFIDLDILEQSAANDDDDNFDEMDINSFRIMNLDFLIEAINTDDTDDNNQAINNIFTSIKKIDYKISSGEIIDLDQKFAYLKALNRAVSLINDLVINNIFENDESTSD